MIDQLWPTIYFIMLNAKHINNKNVDLKLIRMKSKLLKESNNLSRNF